MGVCWHLGKWEGAVKIGRMRQRIWHNTAVRQGVIVFLGARLLFTLWAAGVALLLPTPAEPDEVLRPYLGETQLGGGASGLLLAPWQRFDTQRYMRIARDGYATEEDSVFPPLYPWLVRALSLPLGGNTGARLTAALLISNSAALALLVLLYHVTVRELGETHATRALLYLALFPSGFFLFAAYTEPLFLLLALAALWAGRNGRFAWAGVFGFLAAATRLTGWVLVLPLAYEALRHAISSSHASRLTLHDSRFTFHVLRPPLTRHLLRNLLFAALPGLALLLFLAYRWQLGLPPLTEVYGRYWFQHTGIPGQDIFTAAQTLFFGGEARRNELFALALDFACALLLIVTTALSFRRLGVGYGLYAALLLLFMLLPTSPVKPLYSFSRYALAFFPTFMLLAQWGQNRWVHRLLLYGFLALALFYSGQFFMWGWVG